MKYAIVVTYNRTYLPALNALLNALDYYENIADLHLLYTKDLENILEKIKFKFKYKIITYPVEELFNKEHHDYINLMFAKYSYIERIKDYDAICHLDGDILLLDNIMPYFKIAEIGLIPCAKFPHTEPDMRWFKNKDADWVARNMPMANFPVFYNPKIHMDVIEYCRDNMPKPDNADRERNHEMYVFNMAISKKDCILELNGNTWVGDKYPYHIPLVVSYESGKLTIYNYLLDKIIILHNKYWKEGVAESHIKNSNAKEMIEMNIKIIKDAYKFFNENYKLKLNEL